MSKTLETKCDICGKRISMSLDYYKFPKFLDKVKRKNGMIFGILFKKVTHPFEDELDEEYERDLDICENCYKELRRIIREKISGEGEAND